METLKKWFGNQPSPRKPYKRIRKSSVLPSDTDSAATESDSQLYKTPRKINKKKTLVLDLDETLVHSTSRGSKNHHHTVEVLIDKHICLYYVYKRPHTDYFLEKVCEWYNVVIFTASMSEYADPVIDWLESSSKDVSFKRYFRETCTPLYGSFTKNLSLIEPDLSSVCLIDNSPISYAFNEDNAIPIEGWVGDVQDVALLDLLPFLDALRFVHDVRHVLSLRF